MSQTPQTPPRSPVTLSASRAFVSRAFSIFALGMTLLGMVILAVFCLTLAADVVRWFQVIPQQVAKRNEAILSETAQALAALETLQERRRFLDAREATLRETHNTQIQQSPAADQPRLRKEFEETLLPREMAIEASRLHDKLVRNQPFLEAIFSQIDREQQQDLQNADPARAEEIRKLYELTLRPHKWKDLERTLPELTRVAQNIRPNPSASEALFHFFTHGSSGDAAQAGIRPALFGSLGVVLLALLCALPLGIGAAIYLEEYATRSRLAGVIQVNINNLAGVPSVMYGILGAFVFVELIFRPLESETIKARNLLGGGLTLGLLTLPLIIVAAQEAIRAVPSSLRAGAHALGATRWQVTWRVVLPPATPGLMTGIILAVSRAIGEAAPLLLFGALLIVDQNPGLFDRFTVLPMQIYDWSEQPDDIWRYNAALASAILIGTLLVLNATAIYLRQRFVRNLKW